MRKTLAVLIGAAATITMITGAGVASAATGRPADLPTPVGGIVFFQIMSTSAASTSASIIAVGLPVTAGGVDHQGNKTDLVVFPRGTFKIRHFKGHGTSHFNPATCLIRISRHGTYTLRDGTGAYTGIVGHGTYRLRIRAFGARNSNGNCSQTKPPVVFQQITKARGPVSLP
jgi:hypothetical protein